MNCLTITLNPALDTTLVVRRLEIGGVNRVVRMHIRAGGKGVNVARILAAHGHAVRATGFLGGETGHVIDRALRAAGVQPSFHWLGMGDTRTCHAILDEETRVTTEVLEPGPGLGETDLVALLAVLPAHVAWADMVVVAGSSPPGCTPEFLETLARTVRQGARKFALDASGATLKALLTGRPDLCKPNEEEIAQLMGGPASLDEQIAFIQENLIRGSMAPGARVIYSRGKRGALLITKDEVIEAHSTPIQAVNSVGCGDALVAGYCAAWHDSVSDADLIRAGVATGTAAALQEAAGEVDPGDVARFQDAIEIRPYEPGA